MRQERRLRGDASQNRTKLKTKDMKKKREIEKCKYFAKTDRFPEGECTLEEITWGYPFECSHSQRCKCYERL